MRDRLRQDRATLDARLSDRQAEAIREIVVATDGVYDDGHFRDLLVAVNEEHLKPAQPQDS